MAELICQSKCRSLPARVQANGRGHRMTAGWILLSARKTNKSDREKDGNGEFHFGSSFDFVGY